MKPTAEPPTMAEIMQDEALAVAVDSLKRGEYLPAGFNHKPLAPPATGTEADVCADIAERQRKGIAKYQTTVRANNLTRREWIRHAYEEALDLAVYLKRIMEEMDK